MEELKTKLTDAVVGGDLESLQQMIVKSDESAKRVLKELPLLHIATLNGRIGIVKWLLSDEGRAAAGFTNVSAFLYGNTALHIAVQKGNWDCFQAVVNGCSADNGEREKMLNTASKDLEWTALHSAAYYEHVAIVEWLLSEEGRAAGFDRVLARTKGGSTALHFAARQGFLQVCKAIVNGCRVDNGERHEMLNAVDNYSYSALHHAVDNGHPTVISWLLTDDDGVGAEFDRKNITALTKDHSYSILHLTAAKGSKTNCIRTLLSLCTDGERRSLFLAVSKSGWTALYYAARNKPRGPQIIAELLGNSECDLIVNARDRKGMTVLHRAIIGGVDEESRNGWDQYFEPNVDIIKALLKPSAVAAVDPNVGLGPAE